MSSILIKNAIIVDSNSNYNNTKKDILLENGVISSIKDNITDLNVEIIESDNLHICPGLLISL